MRRVLVVVLLLCFSLAAFAGTHQTTVTVAAPGTVRAEQSNVSTVATTLTSGNLVGVRGSVTIPAATTVSGQTYLYGMQGKAIISGTMTGSAWTFGTVGQIDISAATLTAGSHIGALWGDAGTTGPSASVSFADMLVLTNTTATTFNSHIYVYGKASYLLDMSSNSSAFIDATAHGTTAAGRIKVKVNGADRYLHVFED